MNDNYIYKTEGYKMDLMRNFIIGQELTIGKLKVIIMEYAGITLIRTNTGIAEMQLYKVNVNGSEAYASDSGLSSNNSAIFNRVIASIGYRGNIDINIFKTEYEMWKEMIYHCYYQSNKLYPYYGGIGITIDPRWLCFEIFLYDLINLNGYEKIKNSKCEYVIDIKSKQKNIPESSRIYAPGKISLKQYYKSDIYDNNEKAIASGMASDAGLYYNSYVQPMHNTERKPFFKIHEKVLLSDSRSGRFSSGRRSSVLLLNRFHYIRRERSKKVPAESEKFQKEF